MKRLETLTVLATDPAPQERGPMVGAHAAATMKPVLDDGDWEALKAICRVSQ
jgi:hypothetical protein